MPNAGLSQGLQYPIVDLVFVMTTGSLFSDFILQSVLLINQKQGQWDNSQARLADGGNSDKSS